MHRPWRALGFLAVAVLALNGCGGRAARPVAVTQSFDQQMSCAQIASELEANKVRVNSLHKEDADRHGRNAAMATAGLLLVGVGALFLIDDGEAQATEIQAYTARNNSLTQLASTKGCTDEEMAAAVAANSAGVAAAATSAATTTAASDTGSRGASQVAVAPPQNQQLSQLQAQFDAWYAGNSPALRRALTKVVRDESLLTSCAAGINPSQLLNITTATVAGEQDSALVLSIAYVKPGDSGHCQESRQDRFLVVIENDALKEVSYNGPAASPSSPNAAPAVAANASATAKQTAALPWAGAWHGETNLPSGRVRLEIVEGQVSTRVVYGARSREVTGVLDSSGVYASTVSMVAPWGGVATVSVSGVFPTFTVGFTDQFTREPNRTITVAKQ